MNQNLLKYLSDSFLFIEDTRFIIIALIFFFIAFMLIVYTVVVVSKRTVCRKIAVPLGSKGLGEAAYQDALRILDKARADSLKILSKAQFKAQSVLNSTYTISQESREKLDQNLQEIYSKQENSLKDLSKELLESYKSAVEEGKQENIRTLYEATEAMRKGALLGVDEFKSIIKEETLEAQEALEQKLQTEYSKVESEVQVYKEEKIRNLNKRIFDILSDIYTQVIKQDLDQIGHEKLILELLKEEVKKLGLKYNVHPEPKQKE